VFYANISNISAISWREHFLLLNLDMQKYESLYIVCMAENKVASERCSVKVLLCSS